VYGTTSLCSPPWMGVVHNDAYVLTHEKKISNMKELLPLLEQVAKRAARC
jgi:chaperonin GroEL